MMKIRFHQKTEFWLAETDYVFSSEVFDKKEKNFITSSLLDKILKFPN